MCGERSAIRPRARILGAGSRFGFNRLYDRLTKALRSRRVSVSCSVSMEAECRC